MTAGLVEPVEAAAATRLQETRSGAANGGRNDIGATGGQRRNVVGRGVEKAVEKESAKADWMRFASSLPALNKKLARHPGRVSSADPQPNARVCTDAKHHLSFPKSFLQGRNSGTNAVRRLSLLWLLCGYPALCGHYMLRRRVCRLSLSTPSRVSHLFSIPRNSSPIDEIFPIGPLPVIPPIATNTELQTLLQRIRDDMIIPANLTRSQHDLVFRQRHHHLLAGETTKVGVKGEEIILKPKMGVSTVNRTTYSNALDLMKEKEDFMIIPSLIQAFYQAGRTLREPLMERTVRKLVQAEQWDALIELWAKAPELDFHITKHMVRESARGFYLENEKAAEKQGFDLAKDVAEAKVAGFQEDAEAAEEKPKNNGPKHGRRLLKIVKQMEERNDHRLAQWTDKARLSQDQIIIGNIFAMTCNNSVRYHGGSDDKGYCSEWTNALKDVWQTEKVQGTPSNLAEAKHAVRQYSPILKGLRSAQQVFKGKDLATWCASEYTRLESSIGQWESLIKKWEATKPKSS